MCSAVWSTWVILVTQSFMNKSHRLQLLQVRGDKSYSSACTADGCTGSTLVLVSSVSYQLFYVEENLKRFKYQRDQLIQTLPGTCCLGVLVEFFCMSKASNPLFMNVSNCHIVHCCVFYRGQINQIHSKWN